MFASVSEASLTFTCVCAAVDPAAKVNSQSTSTPQRRVETLAGFAVTKKYKCIASTCTDTWCDANCNHDPKYCPASFCREVAASTPAEVQQNWCILWKASSTTAAPLYVPTYMSKAGTTTTLPTKIVNPSTLSVSDTVWATSSVGWSSWMLIGEWS